MHSFKTFSILKGGANLKKKAKKIFLAEKPAPVLESLFKGMLFSSIKISMITLQPNNNQRDVKGENYF